MHAVITIEILREELEDFFLDEMRKRISSFLVPCESANESL